MWSRIVVVTCALAIAAEITGDNLRPDSRAWAQSPTSTLPVLSSNSQYALLLHEHWLKLEVVGGKLSLMNCRCGQSRTAAVGTEQDAARQSLAIQVLPDLVVVHYESQANGELLTIDADRDRTLIIEQRLVGADQPLLLYKQLGCGRVTLEVGNSTKQVYTARSFWHLMLTHEEVVDQHLLPLLEELRPQWRLAEQLGMVRRHLVDLAGSEELASREQWLQWVKDLASNDFPTRQSADRKLRAAGQAVISVLERIPISDLDAEQRRRVRSIVSDLRDLSHDTPQRVASWLVDDSSAWLSLLDSDETTERRRASDQLTLLWGELVTFDPLAPPKVRQQQISELRARHAATGR